MVNFIDSVFFFYIFVGLYMTSLLLFIYIPRRKEAFSYPKAKPVPVSVIVPCYNAANNIGSTIESLLNLDYPREMIEIIVVDDKSKDNSVEIIKKYEKKYLNVRLIVNSRNSGGAAEPTNIGIKAARYDFIAVTDDDSYPEPDALIKMVGVLLSDKKIGGVTCSVLAKHSKTFMQKLQEIEYTVIAWNRKILDFIDAVYVTPGPFALYRKKVLIDIGLFDVNNMTQDIEIVWRMISHGYVARMCLAAKVYSDTPKKFRHWWRQRIRWNIGGTQCVIKYRKILFRKGMLGAFIVPFFSANLFIGLFGLGLFLYLLFRRLFIIYFSTKYSIYGNATIVRLQELSFSPSILNFFGAALFILGIFFAFYGLNVMKEINVTKRNVFVILFYMLAYLTVYPFIMVTGMYKLATGKYSW
jgi:cellulose synthase/poly-beta-1,6-N-acetylglucosamine synthase-like glycosyltransferase